MVGGAGVHLFFLLSGFGLSLSSSKAQALQFYKRRFHKILAPYYLVVLLIFLLNGFFHIYKTHSLYALGGHIFWYKMFDQSIMGSFGDHFWFISTIIQFYIFAPFIFRLQNHFSTRVFLGSSILISLAYAILTSYAGVSNIRIYNSFFLQYLWEFCLGAVIAAKFTSGKILVSKKYIMISLFVALGGLTCMGAMSLFLGRIGQDFNDIPALLGYTALCVFTYFVTANIQSCQSFFQYMGLISYEIYLTHMLVIHLLKRLFLSFCLDLNLFSSVFFGLPLSIIAAIFLSKFTKLIFKFLPVSTHPDQSKIPTEK